MSKIQQQFPVHPDLDRLLGIMEKLRDPQTGCPWDQAQNFQSIVPFTIEEAYEVAEVIENSQLDELPDELGDLLFQVVFYCQLGKEQGRFDFDDVLKRICNKLEHRHPHVFAGIELSSTVEIKHQWEQIKAEERAAKQQYSAMDNVPNTLPALSRAAKLQKRAAKVGFDWDCLEGVLAKIDEELMEVMVEVHHVKPDQQRIQDEIGDLLFAVVNLARHLHIEPEQALRYGNAKFERRFRCVEVLAQQQGKELRHYSLDELELFWQTAKQIEQHKSD